jgi:hypothetical protein
MQRTSPDPRLVGRAGRPFNVRDAIMQLDQFFEGKSPVHKTMGRIVKRLEKAEIDYVIVGGMALNAHKYHRATIDLDILVTPSGLDEFCKRFAPKYYELVPGRKRRFVDKTSKVEVDVLITGGIPGRGHVTPIRFPDPNAVSEVIDDVRYVNLATLIEMKLAARRHQDFADVEKLIAFNNLDESFAKGLHPSVRDDYIEQLEEKRRQDDYDARE